MVTIETDLKQILNDYYQSFEQKDFKEFMSFYSRNLEVEDIIWKSRWEDYGSFEKDNEPFFNSLQYASFEIEDMIITDYKAAVRGYLSARFHDHIVYNNVPFTQWFEFNEQSKIVKEKAFIAHTEEMLMRSPENKDKVSELVVFKVKSDFVAQYRGEMLDEFRQLVKSFDGFVSHRTIQSFQNECLFVDYVQWENLEYAQNAARKVKELQNDDQYKELLSVFEEIVLFDHFKTV